MKTKILSILALLLTVTQGAWAQTLPTLPTDGTGAYLISSVDDWKTFCEDVTGGITYSGKTVKLTADIIGVTTRTGKKSENSDYPFSGTFDGQGHTMKLNIYTTTTDDITSAPFGYISGATIKNLHITGSETTTAYMRAASIAGFAANSTITNCWSEVALTSGYYKDIDCGAFVATVIKNSSLTLNGCLFTGTITYTNDTGYEGGGMVGWTRDGSTAKLNDCLFAPAGFTVTKYSGHYMFVGGLKRGVLNNCYYNDVAAATSLTKEGKQAFSIVKGDDVSSLAISGEGTKYSVSGITAYATGIKYNDVYYAGSGESVSLALSHADKAGYAFNQYAVAGGGTLTAQTETSATLSMTDANQTINATWTPTYTATFATGNDNTGWTIDPTSDVEGATVTVSYTGENKVKSVTVAPKGALTGKFSVSSTKQVQFSKGNLQAVFASAGTSCTWQFADHQYDYVGNTAANTAVNGNGSVSAAGVVDHFGWSTSANYYGINPSNESNSYLGDFVDWGQNTITNGCTGWRTLTKDEWGYLFTDRANASTLRTFATVNSVTGLIVMPDGWTASGVSLTITTANYTTNNLSTSQWATLEKQGCVFLPTAGYSAGTAVNGVGTRGDYWSSTIYNENHGYDVHFDTGGVRPQSYSSRIYGLSVRLVRDVE